jgi:precorrin-6Y C5,15-methyltransferase (decarboxylating)
VEAARFGAAVIAVDRDADACARIEAAARKFGVQVHVVHGIAPEALEDLPEPDVVRLGAGCGADVVAACVARRPERIAASAINRDDAEAVSQALEDGGYAVERALLQAVELDSRWGETERAVAFALCGHRR